MSQTAVQQDLQSQRAAMADEHIGALIRVRRVMMGLSQQQLAKLIGVTYQQLNKYERGLNRISASRLSDVAQALRVDAAWFFQGLGKESAVEDVASRQRMLLDLMRNFVLIKDEKQQEAVTFLARSLASS
ncbi:helix-turn-helix transcriptional regulator [Belnapia sp. T18]|uniref:Helix-turn-helix transcriptional regulator n=1 Tax=Belnapia arida TaxID=2804533 RepID=A0ABS1UDI3_9PROT|nr:helix-turn-helix transcriptional regulator [Belnapia arida]MBL6082756.1 helix-turn-helix transcriptional regulator [Belnapia arida]